MISVQSLLRLVYPLELRIKCHSALTRLGWKPHLSESSLATAPVSLKALIPGDAVCDHILATGIYDLALSRFMSNLACKPGGLMIDAGANIGYFTALWASLNGNNRVIAFEPSPRNVAMLKDNLAHAGIANRVSLVSKALGRAAGEASFEVGPDEQTGWGMFATADGAGQIHVPVVKLDDVVPEKDHVTVLKIDCQGADTWVMEGAEKLLAEKRISHIFYEVCPPLLEKLNIPPSAATDWLERFDYRVEVFGNPEDGIMHAFV